MIWRIHWQSAELFWLLALALVGALALIWFLYRPQLVSAQRAWLLPSLRGLAVTVLAVSLLGPAIRVPAVRDARQTVAVLVDRSRSMGVVDTNRSPADLVRLAAALDALPQGIRPSDLSDLRQRVEDLSPLADQVSRARFEQEYARLSGRELAAAGAHLRASRTALLSGVRDISASSPASFHDEIAAIGSDDAAERIASLLSRIDSVQGAADDELYRSSEVVRQACNELATQTRLELVGRAVQVDRGVMKRLDADWNVAVFGYDGAVESLPADWNAADAPGARTDLVAALRELRRNLGAAKTSAVVLFSDGREADAQTGVSAAWPDVTVFAVDAGEPVAKDIAIDRVWIPPTSYPGETFEIRVDLRAVGYDGGRVEVSAEADGSSHSETARIDGGMARVQVPLKLMNPGPQDVTIRVAPLAGEVTAGNNVIHRIVKVVSQQTSVMLLRGAVTRDYLELRKALSHSGAVALTEYAATSLGCEALPDELMAQDVVVLSDVAAGALDSQQWAAISRLARDRGGSVVILPADPAVVSAYAAHPVAGSLLPWRGDSPAAWRIWPGEDPVFRIVPSSAEIGQSLEPWSDLTANPDRWQEISPVFRVLATPQLKAGARPMLMDRDSTLPALIDMPLGAGRVLFLGINEIWRWRLGLDPRDDDRIWLRLIRSAVREPFAATDGVISLDADQLHIVLGQPLAVRAGFGSVDAPFDGAATLSVERDGMAIRTEDLTARAPSGEAKIMFSDLPEGKYRLHLRGGDHSIFLPVEVAASDEEELRDVSHDPAALRNLAGSRGQVLSLGDLRSLPRRLDKLRQSEQAFTEMRLWDSPYLFLFVLGCLGLEWGLRSRGGLA